MIMKTKKKKKITFIILLSLIVIELGAIVAIFAFNYDLFNFASAKNSKMFVTSMPEKKDIKSGSAVAPAAKSQASSADNSDELGYADSSYFDDALFIGDSRTVGLRAFGDFYTSDFFAKTGINVNAFFTYPALDEVTSLTLTQTLLQKQYNKIYIMIGVNDACAVSLEDFTTQFFDAVEKIQSLQPNAVIYVQSILGVTKNRELTDPAHFNNAYVLERNAVLKSRCDGEKLVYLDVFSVFADNEGYLDSNISSDGLHLNGVNYVTWCDYLRAHVKKSRG